MPKLQEVLDRLARMTRFWLSLIAAFLMFLSALVPFTSLLDSFTVVITGFYLLLPTYRRIISAIAQLWLMVRNAGYPVRRGEGRSVYGNVIFYEGGVAPISFSICC